MADKKLVFDIIANDHYSKTTDHAAESTGRLHGAMSNLGGVAKVGLAVGFGAAAAGVGLFSAKLIGGINDAAAYEVLARKTANVIKSTGNAAHISVGGVQALAGSLESLSGVDETQIINSQNLLATFTNIQNSAGKGNDIFNQATKASLDLSVAFGTDLQGASMQVGKALNDPIKGITALSRAGVSFTKQQKEQIKALVESGNKMGAQKVILAELNKEVGGAAKAAGSGFTGAWARVQDVIGDTFRSLGQQLLPSLTKLGNWVADVGLPKTIEFAGKVGPFLSQAFSMLGQAITPVINWVTGSLIPAWVRVAGSIIPALRSAIASASSALHDHQGAVKFVQAIFVILGALLTTILIPAFGAVARMIIGTLGPAFRLILTLVDTVVIPAFRLISSVFLSVAGAIVHGAAWAFGWIPGIGDKLKTAERGFDTFRDQVNAALNGIHDKDVHVAVTTTYITKYVNAGGSTAASHLADLNRLSRHAGGGSPRLGRMVLVGESGPELVRFDSPARISPNGIRPSGSDGGEYHFHFHAPVGSKDELTRWVTEGMRRAQRRGLGYA